MLQFLQESGKKAIDEAIAVINNEEDEGVDEDFWSRS